MKNHSSSPFQPVNGNIQRLKRVVAGKIDFRALDQLAEWAQKSNLTAETVQSITTYLQECLEQDEQHLQIMVHIILTTRQWWPLESHARTFFIQLKEAKPHSFVALLATLHAYCNQHKRLIKAHHINTVIAHLNEEKLFFSTSAQCCEELNAFLTPRYVDLPFKLQMLRQDLLPALNTQAKNYHLSHHTQQHAAEIKIRTLRAIQQLRLFQDSTLIDDFIQKIVSLAVECHDLIQKNAGDFASVEQASATEVLKCLDSVLDMPPSIRRFVKLIVEKVIVLGTTMIYSPTHIMDLSQLYFLFKEKAAEAAIIPSPSAIMTRLNVIMLLTGICDKAPSAIYQVVQHQLASKDANSLANLKYNFTNILLEDFFSSPHFTPYFDDGTEEENRQAFLMSIVPHISMRCELATAYVITREMIASIWPELSMRTNPANQVVEDFLLDCFQYDAPVLSSEALDDRIRIHNVDARFPLPAQNIHRIYEHFREKLMLRQQAIFLSDTLRYWQSQYAQLHDFATFTPWFDAHFREQKGDFFTAMQQIFFANLESEKAFAESLLDWLSNTQTTLQMLVDTPATFIQPTMPHIDAQNLLSLRQWMNTLEPKQQRKVVKELLFNQTCQAGIIYNCLSKKEAVIDYSPSRTKNYTPGFYAVTPKATQKKSSSLPMITPQSNQNTSSGSSMNR